MVTADDQTKTYGSPVLPPFTAHYSGFVNGDTAASLTQPLTFKTLRTRPARSAITRLPLRAARARITRSATSPGRCTYTKAVVTVTAEDKSKIYGDPLPTFSARYDGFVNGDTPAGLTQPVVMSTSADRHSPVGVYQIRPTGGASANYSLVLNNGVLTVNKAALTIAADNLSKAYGDPLPSFTASYSGLVNGDTIASLARPAKLSTTATVNSPLGKYPILVSGADAPNYTIRYVSGVLSILDANPATTSELSDFNVGGDGSLTVRVAATSGSKVQLEWSDDLITWHALAMKAAVSGQAQFPVAGLGRVPLRFFRAVPVTE